MKSNIRDIGDTRIIELGGKITIGTGDVKIRELISQALEDDKKNVLFDLGGVTAIDSSGIGEMVACYTTVTKRGGQLKLMHLEKPSGASNSGSSTRSRFRSARFDHYLCRVFAICNRVDL